MNRRAWLLIALLLAAGLAWAVTQTVRQANEAARASAQYALWSEIIRLLKEREATGQFPQSLSELPLTYPDGGDSELLKLFEYRCEGTTCEIETTIWGDRKTASFGRASPR